MSNSIDNRERMANQLLMRGHATMREILAASFGEWPPKGLDINPDITHDQVIIFKPMLSGGAERHVDRNFLLRVANTLRIMRKIQGVAQQTGARAISVDKLQCPILPWRFGGGDLNLTLGHEVVYILQGDHFERAHEIFGLDTAQTIRRQQKDMASNVIMESMLAETAHEHRALLKLFKAAACAPRVAVGIDVQARLHQIMMNGYQYWGKMPQNTDELHAALYNAGLKMPQRIVDHLKSLSWMSPVQNFLEAPKHHDASFVLRHIQTVSDALTPSGRQIFWNKTVLVLYADLIEMYGDMPGRERFGFGENPKAGYKQVPVDNSPSLPMSS